MKCNHLCNLIILLLISILCSCSLNNKVINNRNSVYLLTYFKEDTHSIYFAVSSDGYTFIDINNGNPAIKGDTLALQKGVRDPHLLKGPDGAFYLSMTDLHINPIRHGYRDTRWERDEKVYGWGNNRSLVLMKSYDLINWDRTIIRFDKIFDGYDDLGCVWAPQTIYDENEKKMMLYFTMRMKNERERIYYSYVNWDYNQILTKPKKIFDYPKSNIAVIDGDLHKKDDTYHMFYVSHDGAGIKQMKSKTLTDDYIYDDKWYDSEEKGCEGPNIWKRIDEDKWVLMYDIYGMKPNNFGFRETSDFINFTDLGRFNEGVMKAVNFSQPKHGSVTHISLNQAKKLINHFGNNVRL